MAAIRPVGNRFERIAIVGAGGVGAYLGGMLARAGEDVTFVARGESLAAIPARGIVIRIDTTGTITVPAAATDAPATIGPVDLIAVCVKTYDIGAAAERMRPLVGPQTTILTIQNGVDAAERVGRVLGVPDILAAALYFSVTRLELGVVEKIGGPGGRVVLGNPASGATPHVEAVAATLRDAGFDVQIPPDIRVALWEKLVAIISHGTLTALTRLPGGALLGCEETRQLISGLIAEGAAVARACGVQLPPDIVDRTEAAVRHLPPQARSSQYYDLEAGRRLETEALNGAIVRLGHAHGVATPLNFAVYAALRPYVGGAPVCA